MIKQITHISTHQSAKVVSALYVLFTLPFVLVGIVGLIFSPAGSNFPFWFFFIAPLFYGGMGYVISRSIFWIYNHVAKRIGGIEFSTTEIQEKSNR
ncbi:hypothetical protein [Pseudogulbenkiania ferrooxidans]|uniref:hypothetical protein n=1 Tax=Pseudogulbenkiania ferrooxidans TaxID=549169 RepID=UPI0012371808|nr:hypothetical protein [Pseudogulbenkiania ferrooxidans]